MFLSTGEKVLKESNTGTWQEQLRSAGTDDQVRHIETLESKLAELDEVWRPRNLLLEKIYATLNSPKFEGDDRVGLVLELLRADKGPKESKRFQQTKTLQGQLKDMLRKHGKRLLEHEKLCESSTTAMAGGLKEEHINVPPLHSQAKRTPLLSSDAHVVKKKRKTAAPPAESKNKKQRKKREIKPQKQEARKASLAYKRQQKELQSMKKE